MKQNLNKEQLQQLVYDKGKIMYNRLQDKLKLNMHQPIIPETLTIGKLMEILNNEQYEVCIFDRIKEGIVEDVHNDRHLGRWEVMTDSYKEGNLLSSDPNFYQDDELVNALWKAVVDML